MDANEFPAQLVPNLEYGQSVMELGIPTGPLRAPRSNALGFVFQSFIDELAYRAGKDPVEFRLALLGERRVLVNSTGKPDALRDFDTGRMRDVLLHVAEISGWPDRQALPKRTGKGVAFYFSHLGYFAEVVQASVGSSGDIKLNQVWIVADVGRQIINPSGAENQVQGAVLDGLGAALGQAITIDRGRVVQSNFDGVRPLRMSQAPPVEVRFLSTDHPPTGLGEPALPPVIPGPMQRHLCRDRQANPQPADRHRGAEELAATLGTPLPTTAELCFPVRFLRRYLWTYQGEENGGSGYLGLSRCDRCRRWPARAGAQSRAGRHGASNGGLRLARSPRICRTDGRHGPSADGSQAGFARGCQGHRREADKWTAPAERVVHETERANIVSSASVRSFRYARSTANGTGSTIPTWPR